MSSFEELTAFVRVVNHGSQSGAARELGITPAMVGRHIRSLEDRMGVRLLNRTTKTQSLTGTGQVFYRRILAILDQLQEAELEAAEQSPEPSGVLRISGPVTFGWRYLSPAISRFCVKHPRLSVELTLDDRFTNLVEGGYDMALRIGALKSSTLISRRLASSRMVVCAAPSYLSRAREPVSPADLSTAPCLLYAYDSSKDVWRFKTGHKVRVRGALLCNNGDALLAAAIAGLGVILQPHFVVKEALEAGKLTELLRLHPARDIGIHAVYPSASHLPLKTRSLVSFLVRELAEI